MCHKLPGPRLSPPVLQLNVMYDDVSAVDGGDVCPACLQEEMPLPWAAAVTAATVAMPGATAAAAAAAAASGVSSQTVTLAAPEAALLVRVWHWPLQPAGQQLQQPGVQHVLSLAAAASGWQQV